MPALPKFTEYRLGNDAVMVADIGFKKQLFALDPELDVLWDWGSEKWEIWRFPRQKKLVKKPSPEAHHVMTIQTFGRDFRELGADILLKLQMSDTHNFTLKQLIDYFDQMDKNIEREQTRKLVDKIGAMNREILEFTGTIKQPVPRQYNFETPSTLRVRRAISGGL